MEWKIVGIVSIVFYIPIYIIALITGTWLSSAFARKPLSKKTSNPITTINLNIFGAIGSAMLPYLASHIINPKSVEESMLLAVFIIFVIPLIAGFVICQTAELLSSTLKEKAPKLYHIGIGAFHGTWLSIFPLVMTGIIK